MPDLVNQDASGVERGRGTSRKSLVLKKDSILRGLSREFRREGGPTEETTGFIVIKTEGVNIECVGTSPPKSLLHGSLPGIFRSNIVEKIGIHYPGDTRQDKCETNLAKFIVQDLDLPTDLGVAGMSDEES